MNVSVRSLTDPVGLLRLASLVLSGLSFGLVATTHYGEHISYWAWCMFTWCFCCFFTLLVLILEFAALSDKVPVSWEDFTTAFAMLAALMCLAASAIYPTFFACKACPRQIGATVTSWLCCLAYGGEVAVTWLRPRGQISGFLSTVPGLLKILETFLACIIFTSLDPAKFYGSPGLQWCVSVYCMCFICALCIILLTISRLLSYFPASFERLVTAYNVLAAMMYLTTVVMWPLYGFRQTTPYSDPWNKVLVVTFMSIFNFVVYTVDCVFSIRMVFWPQESS